MEDNRIAQMLSSKFNNIDEALDFIEMKIVNEMDIMDFPVEHTFTKGLYAREIHMPAGSLLTSKIHKTEHQFRILKGHVAVLDQNGEWLFLEAGHKGITYPNTRRLLYCFSDVIWETFHPTDKTTVAEVESDIIEVRDNKFIGDLKEAKICRGLQLEQE